MEQLLRLNEFEKEFETGVGLLHERCRLIRTRLFPGSESNEEKEPEFDPSYHFTFVLKQGEILKRTLYVCNEVYETVCIPKPSRDCSAKEPEMPSGLRAIDSSIETLKEIQLTLGDIKNSFLGVCEQPGEPSESATSYIGLCQDVLTLLRENLEICDQIMDFLGINQEGGIKSR